MKAITYILLALILIPSSLAVVDVFQGRHSVVATGIIDPGPRGLGGFLTEINQTVQVKKITLEVSGTWFQKFDKIIIDALVMDGGVPVSGVNCTLSIKDSEFVEILTNEQMFENSIGGQPHYTYNNSNISAIASPQDVGKFFGHVKCVKSPPKPFTIYSESDFEVHEIEANIGNVTVDNTEVLTQIANTRAFLGALLNRQYDFSQEEVFLVTDAFNSMTNILNAVGRGEMSEDEANSQFMNIEQRLRETVGVYKQAKATIQPKAAPSQLISTFSLTERFDEWSTKELLYLAIFVLLVSNILVVAIRRRKSKFEEMW